MKKTIILILMLVAIGAVAYFVKSKTPSADTAPLQSNTSEVAGTIVSIDTNQVAADGPALLVVKDAIGGEKTIAVPSMGINLCAARDNIADVFALKVGEQISARGSVGEFGQIVPCEAPDHYLRKITQ